MESSIVIIPGHAYIAVRVDNVNDYYYFIETTMIGAATFNDAVKYGLAEWNDAAASVNARRGLRLGQHRRGPRHDGITPIPWR